MRAVVDTTVLGVANGQAVPQASSTCVRNATYHLELIQKNGVVVLDDDWRILKEYGRRARTAPNAAGSVFYKWVLNNYANSQHCERYSITPQPDDPNSFTEFPADPALIGFDPSDRKFVALAIVSQAPVWNAVDSDYWNHREALEANGIIIKWICPEYFHQTD